MTHRHTALRDPHPIEELLKDGVDNLELLTLSIFDAACEDLGLEAPKGRLDPYAVGLEPDRWAMDGLHRARRARERSAKLRGELAYVLGKEQV